LKLEYEEPLLRFAFNINLRHYNVGVLDTETNGFSTIATTGDAASGDGKYLGAAAVGNMVYFAPAVGPDQIFL